MPIKVGMVSLGCSKNQVDAEIMLSKIKKAGFELCTDSGSCDVVIINTCGFIEDAKKEAIENILEFCTLKKEGKIKVIVVTGCLAERYQKEIAKEIPEADVVLGIGSNDNIVEAINKALKGDKVYEFGPKENCPLNGDRIISNLPFFAYLKIADGCDNFCTYCAIPMIRGRYRSREMDDVVAEAQMLADHGVTEIIVVAQDPTRYGEDLNNGNCMLPELLRRLCRIEKLHWVRVLYCYPERITDELLDVMAEEDKLVKYFDIPIQHVSEHVLKDMNRVGSPKELRELMEKIRSKIPSVVLRTTLITGFPGETEEDFTELCNFVKDVKFDRLGCFTYSAEEGTPAAEMPNQVDEEIKQRRADVIMLEQSRIVEEKNSAMIGKTVEVVVEGFDRYAESFFGRSAADAPDIDGKVFFTSENKLKMGQYVNVQIDDIMDYDLIGTVVE